MSELVTIDSTPGIRPRLRGVIDVAMTWLGIAVLSLGVILSALWSLFLGWLLWRGLVWLLFAVGG